MAKRCARGCGLRSRRRKIILPRAAPARVDKFELVRVSFMGEPRPLVRRRWMGLWFSGSQKGSRVCLPRRSLNEFRLF